MPDDKQAVMAPAMALLFGLVRPPSVPRGAPRRRIKMMDADEGECQSPAYLAAKVRRARLLAWLRKGGERSTVDVADVMCISAPCAFNDLRLLRSQGQVEESRRELVRGRFVVFWRATR